MSAEVVRAAKTEIGLESFGDTVIKLKWNLLLGIRFNFFLRLARKAQKNRRRTCPSAFCFGKNQSEMSYCSFANLRSDVSDFFISISSRNAMMSSKFGVFISGVVLKTDSVYKLEYFFALLIILVAILVANLDVKKKNAK